MKYIAEYKKECILAPLFKMIEAIFELFVPLVIAYLIDIGIGESDNGAIIKSALLLFVLALVGLTSSLTAQYFSAKAAIGVSTKLRYDLFSFYQEFSFSDMDKIGADTMLNRLTSDVMLVQNGINMTLRLFLRSPFIVFGAMIMAFTINTQAALIFVITIPALAIVVYGIMTLSVPIYKLVQEKLDGILHRSSENVSGIRVIRAFGIEDKEISQFNEQNESLNKLQRKVGNLSGLESPITFIIVNAATIVLLYTGAVKSDAGIITKGAVVALINYMSQILVELVKLANLIVTISKALAGVGRLKEMFNTPLAKKQSQNYVNQTDLAVRFKNVSLKYDGTKEPSLSDISFDVYKGQTIGIIGGTGSGKTSLIDLIAGHYAVTEGILEIAKDASQISVVMQKAALFKGTIEDNLRFAKEDATNEEMINALKISQAYDFVFNKDGLKTEVAQGGSNFSGGQKQRLNIARGLVKPFDILILDDSFSALDYVTDAALRKAIKDNCADATVFIVSQRASSVMDADNIVVLDDGKMVDFGNHEELLSRCDIYKEIYYTQFQK